ncbi:extracellular solute-binding protein [Lacisediminihabitans changchengi]|uniref:Extracellular solute-binding protein n=1 Tax=Lacisediminihabitans changchengi TaxID=2787634 RepID=A0A934SQE6_9MICO|nr:extracellular solute-binding protein [Lacisediminihabitans changchengi]MBK4346274.1 extracellular solute-binding protein [Lacisediminihabitans changchengi]
MQFFDAYAKQHQLEPLDSYITADKYSLDRFNVGVSAWKYTDGKQYGLPLDWAAPAFFYNKDMVEKAGLTDKDIQTMTWNPKDGGTFDKIAARLTTDVNGKHADEAGFDKDHVAVYGSGLLGSSDFLGQTTWGSFISTTGWRLGNKDSWPTAFQYDKPIFAQTMEYMRGLSDRGIAPKFGEFTIGGTEQLGSGKVALLEDGSWTASTALQLPGLKIGVAPTVLGPDGTTRASLSNSNGNEIWAGSKNKEAAWKWISYMGTEGCQTKAALVSGSFFPSIPGAMKTFAASQKSKGVDLSVFENAAQKKEIYPASPYANGSDIGTTLTPMFESYMLHETNGEVFPKLYTAAKNVIAGKN